MSTDGNWEGKGYRDRIVWWDRGRIISGPFRQRIYEEFYRILNLLEFFLCSSLEQTIDHIEILQNSYEMTQSIGILVEI